VVCRSQYILTEDTKKKISLFCHVPPENVVGVHDVSNIYRVPLLLHQQGLPQMVIQRLQLSPIHYSPLLQTNGKLEVNHSNGDQHAVPSWLAGWNELAHRLDRMHNSALHPIHIAMVGKYTGLGDAYLSVVKALEHASLELNRRLVIDWIEASNLEEIPNNDTRYANLSLLS
jgi:CTP synthase